MSYKKTGTGEVLGSKDFQRMPQKMRKGWIGSQEQATHRLVEPKAKKGQPVVYSGEIEKIPAPPVVEGDENDDDGDEKNDE